MNTLDLRNKDKEKGGTIFIFLLVAVIVAELIYQIPKAIQKQETIDCLKWQKWTQQGLGDFTPSKEMQEQCKAVGIIL